MSRLKSCLKKNKVIYGLWMKLKFYVADVNAVKKFRNQCKCGCRNDNPRVVFMAQYIPSWKKIEPIYKAMLKNPCATPVIFCVPSNIENRELIPNEKGKSYNDTYEYFYKRGYEVVNAFDNEGNWKDLRSLEPDFVFYTRPYNEVMPMIYSSDEVSKFSKICVISYGVNPMKNVFEIGLNNDFFKDVYCHFTGIKEEKDILNERYKKSCKLGLRKVCMYGAPIYEEILKCRDERNNAWDFAQDKLKIMWTPRWTTDKSIGGTNFFEYKDSILNYAENHNDVAILIRPHPLMFDNFIKKGEMSVAEVQNYKKRIESMGNVRLDTEKEYVATFWGSDILVGDISSIISEYFVTDKPIIYCDTNVGTELAEYAKVLVEGCYKVYSESELYDRLDRLHQGIDELKDKRVKIKEQLFGSTIDTCTDNIVKEICQK